MSKSTRALLVLEALENRLVPTIRTMPDFYQAEGTMVLEKNLRATSITRSMEAHAIKNYDTSTNEQYESSLYAAMASLDVSATAQNGRITGLYMSVHTGVGHQALEQEDDGAPLKATSEVVQAYTMLRIEGYGDLNLVVTSEVHAQSSQLFYIPGVTNDERKWREQNANTTFQLSASGMFQVSVTVYAGDHSMDFNYQEPGNQQVASVVQGNAYVNVHTLSDSFVISDPSLRNESSQSISENGGRDWETNSARTNTQGTATGTKDGSMRVSSNDQYVKGYTVDGGAADEFFGGRIGIDDRKGNLERQGGGSIAVEIYDKKDNMQMTDPKNIGIALLLRGNRYGDQDIVGVLLEDYYWIAGKIQFHSHD